MNPVQILDRKDRRWTSTMATMMRVAKQRYSNKMGYHVRVRQSLFNGNGSKS